MYTVLLKTKSRSHPSLGEKLWNEFAQQTIPFNDRIKIIARESQTVWMHKSVIKKISGLWVLHSQDSCQYRTNLSLRGSHSYHHSDLSTLIGFSGSRYDRRFINCIYVDIGIIHCVAKLMYHGSVLVPEKDLQQFFSACQHFKIQYLDTATPEQPKDSHTEQIEPIIVVGSLEDAHQSNNPVSDGDDAMEIDEQPQTDLCTSCGYQSSESDTDDSNSDNEISNLLMTPPREKQEPDSEMNVQLKEQQPDSEMNPLRRKKQLDSDSVPEDGFPSAKRFKPGP